MKHALFKIKTKENRELDDDAVVEEIMDKLMLNYPQIHGYIYERTGPEQLNILMYGDIEIGI